MVTKKAVVVSEETRVVNGRDPDLIGKIIGNFTEEVTGGLEDLESPNTDSGISSVRICQSQTLLFRFNSSVLSNQSVQIV